MPTPPEQTLKFFVYVMESPSATDIYDGRSEGGCLGQVLKLNNIRCVTRTAVNKPAFVSALYTGLAEAINAETGKQPILHISAHGSTDGIQLTDGSIVSWDELRELLKPVNKALNGRLVVCMSSCKGYMGTRMAMEQLQQEYPFFALVGSGDSPTWSETAVGFSTFYHQMVRGSHVSAAVAVMRAASGHAHFFVEWAEIARRNYHNAVGAMSFGALAQASQALRTAERDGTKLGRGLFDNQPVPAPAGQFH